MRFCKIGLVMCLNQDRGGTEMIRNNFGVSQPRPSDGENQLRCVYLDPGQEFQWFTDQCYRHLNFVCQYCAYVSILYSSEFWAFYEIRM